MIDPVEETLKLWRTTPFKWGTDDCLISLADYVFLITGIDYGKKYRGKYSTEKEAKKLIKLAGNEVFLINELIDFLPVVIPERGDIVICSVGKHRIGGICTGQSIAMRSVKSVVEININFCKIIRAWSVPKCRQFSQQ